MARYTEEYTASPYHVDDVRSDLDELKRHIEAELEDAYDVIDWKYVGVRTMTQSDCDERNEIDFEGDVVLSPKWNREIVYNTTREI